MGGRAGGGASGGMGSRSRANVSAGVTERGYSQALTKAMLTKEDEIVRNPYETLAAFDANGKLLHTQIGHAIDTGLVAEGDVKGRFVTHNHPTNASFSRSDVIMASTMGTNELRARTPKYTYSLRPSSSKGWGASERKIKAAYTDAERRVTDWNRNYLKTYKGDKSAAYKRMLSVKNHRINKIMAKQFGWEYTWKTNK